MDFPSCDFFLPIHHFSTGLLPFIEIFYRCPLSATESSQPFISAMSQKFFSMSFFFFIFGFLFFYHAEIYICMYVFTRSDITVFVLWLLYFGPQLQTPSLLKLKKFAYILL